MAVNSTHCHCFHVRTQQILLNVLIYSHVCFFHLLKYAILSHSGEIFNVQAAYSKKWILRRLKNKKLRIENLNETTKKKKDTVKDLSLYTHSTVYKYTNIHTIYNAALSVSWPYCILSNIAWDSVCPAMMLHYTVWWLWGRYNISLYEAK